MRLLGLCTALVVLSLAPVILTAAPSSPSAVFGYSISDTDADPGPAVKFHLYRIDLTTGAATDQGLVNASEDDDLEGLASKGGTLFAVGEANHGRGDLRDVTVPPGKLVGRSRRFGTEAGAAYCRLDDTIYDLQADDTFAGRKSRLYKLNPNTGAAVLVGADREYADGLAIRVRNGECQAYATDFRADDGNGRFLYRLNLATGKLRAIGSGLGVDPGDDQDSGASFDPATGTLWALTEGEADVITAKTYTIDTSTGVATFQAEVGDVIPQLEGLDIPEP